MRLHDSIFSGLRWVGPIMAVVLPAPVLRADGMILDNGLRYRGTITGYADYTLILRVGGGQVVEKPLAEVRQITLDALPDVSSAEVQMQKNEAELALRLYARARTRASEDWQKRLIDDRAYQATIAAGRTDEAVAIWLDRLADSEVPTKIFALRPGKFADAGEKANSLALERLDAWVRNRSAEIDRDVLVAVLELMLELQRHEGRRQAAAATTQHLAELQDGEEADTSQPAARPEGADTQANPDFAALEILLEAGKGGDVVKALQDRIADLPRAERPAAWLLLGRAQWQVGQGDAMDRTMLIRAGLNFMRVFAWYPASPKAAEALYRAAMVHRALGDRRAGCLALEELLQRYAQDSPDPVWVARARRELEAMTSQDAPPLRGDRASGHIEESRPGPGPAGRNERDKER